MVSIHVDRSFIGGEKYRYFGIYRYFSVGIPVFGKVQYRFYLFQILLGCPVLDAVWSPEHFDTFFNEIGWKMRECSPKNDFQGGGSEGVMKSVCLRGSWKVFFCKFWWFKSYWNHFWVLIYGFGVNKSISAVKITIHYFISLKSSVLFKIWWWWLTGTPSFFNQFHLKRGQNVQEIILHQIQDSPKEFETSPFFDPYIAHLYLYWQIEPGVFLT